jgi:hypothetical protein
MWRWASRSACRADILPRVTHSRWIAAAALCVFLTMPGQALAQTAPSPAPATPATAEPNPLTNIVQNLGRDLRDFASFETLVILSAGGAGSLIASQSDDRVDSWALDHPAGSWTSLGRIGGDGWTQGGIALSTWAVGTLTEHRLTAHVGSDLMRAQMVNMVTTRVLKIAADRRRPSGGGHAFPSGHTSASFTTAAVLQRHFGWRAGVPAYAAAGFVGLTRVRDRSHWVSDTVFGAAMGVAAAWTVTRGHDSRTWTITPVATPGGGALVVRW